VLLSVVCDNFLNKVIFRFYGGENGKVRIIITFQAEREVGLPIHYNHILQGFIYNNLSDYDYRRFLHEEGYQYEKRKFKLFTFSRLEGRFRMERERRRIFFDSPFRLVVSSAVDKFITDLAETLIRAELLTMGRNVVEVSGISVQKDPDFTDKLQIKMISPMVTYSTIEENGQKTTHYYSPWSSQFSEHTRNNLIKKHQLIHGSFPSTDQFTIFPNGNRERDFRRIISFKGNPVSAWAGIYWLVGNPELIKVAYHTGLGSKNSQGFGCFEVVR
jgi:CRISPR-associated endoribonuclease Cas6